MGASTAKNKRPSLSLHLSPAFLGLPVFGFIPAGENRISFFFLVCRSKVHAELLIPPVLNDMKTHYVFFFFFFLFHIISQKG
jgi:uncharacterized membrane protein YwaF